MTINTTYLILLSLFLTFSTNAQKTDMREIAQSNDLSYLGEIHFISHDTIFLEADSKIWLSFNGGRSWKDYALSDRSGYSYQIISTSSWIRLHDQKLDEYMLTTDTGRTYRKVSPPFEVYNYTLTIYDDIWFARNVTEKGKFELLSTIDKGKIWNVNQDSFVGSPIIRNDSLIVFGGLYNNKDKNYYNYWLSHDLGKTFIGHGFRHNDKSLTYVSIDTAYYVVNDYSDYTITIFWSFDGGKTIHTQFSTSFGSAENVGNIKMANSKIGYRNSGNKLYKTYNGGQTWYYKYTFECPISNIEVIDQNHVYFHHLGGSQSVNKCIYVTHNGAAPLVVTQEEPQKNDFKLYPNPANQSISLQTPNGANAALCIYNLMGQIQYQNPAQAPGNIDISHLATGLYIFELRQGSAVHRQRIEVVK